MVMAAIGRAIGTMDMLIVPVMVMMVVAMMIVIVVVRLGLQEGRLDFQDAVEVEGIAAEHGLERHVALHRAMQGGIGIDAADARLDLLQLGLGDEIGLVDDDNIGEGDLVLGLRRILEPRGQKFCIGHRHHGVEPRGVLDLLVDEEGLRDRGRIGQSRRLDDDRVELALALHQAFDDADEIAAHGAADAAVVHLEDFLVGADHEVIVDANLAEFIDDDRVFLAVLLGEDPVEERRLAGTEIAGEHRDGGLVGHERTPEADGCAPAVRGQNMSGHVTAGRPGVKGRSRFLVIARSEATWQSISGRP